jgi:hypothetical protein
MKDHVHLRRGSDGLYSFPEDDDLTERFAAAIRARRRPKILHPTRRAAVAWTVKCAWLRLRNKIAIAYLQIRYRR